MDIPSGDNDVEKWLSMGAFSEDKVKRQPNYGQKLDFSKFEFAAKNDHLRRWGIGWRCYVSNFGRIGQLAVELNKKTDFPKFEFFRQK